MLQRAASNAYSWWWASHIRTKQSKWLEQNLQDMEEKVNTTIQIIDEDGDTFAQRAEMYYKKRPELLNFVEEFYRSYRALAERYDHLSRELQSANRTIASVFPERVQLSMDEEDEENLAQTSRDTLAVPKPGIPKVPNIPKKDFRSSSMVMTRKKQLNRIASTAKATSSPRSGLSKSEALEEIDRHQKGILAIQTETEFVKSSYENAYAKYWELENQIAEMQQKICSLQDEFGIGTVIDDNEARTLMATTALNSCQETLVRLQEKHQESTDEAKIDHQRIKEARQKFATLRNKFLFEETDQHYPIAEHEFESSDLELDDADQQEKHDLELFLEKIKKQLDVNSNTPLTVSELAEKVDELVGKVVTLETDVSSQTALVNRLRSETDELMAHIRRLEEKEGLIENSDNMRNRMKAMEEELSRVKALNQSVKDQNKNLLTQFTEATCNIDHFIQKLQKVKLEEEVEDLGLFQEVKAVPDAKSDKGVKEHEDKLAAGDSSGIAEDTKREQEDAEDVLSNSVKAEGGKYIESDPSDMSAQKEKDEEKDLSETINSNLDDETEEMGTEEEGEQPDWRQLFLNGLEDREKILLDEYSSVLRNYKEVKMKLGDVEKKNRGGFFELALQIRELKNAVFQRDVEIQSLRQKMTSPQKNPDETPTEYNQEGGPESIILAASSQNSTLSSPVSHQQPVSYLPGDEIKAKHVDKPREILTIEEKVRSEIDELLEESLEFWLRFSTSVHQIKKFQTSVRDLKAELLKLKDRMKQEGSDKQQSLNSDGRPIYKHMREIQTELTLWLENNGILKEELQGRYSSLCNIQQEISRVANAGSKAGDEISEYQAAKFQGEIRNMKQENIKVADELQAGLDRVKVLKAEVEKILAILDEDLGISASRTPNRSSSNRPRIPLRSFLFGVKLKKQKNQKQQKSSLLSCINPALQKQHSNLTAAGPLRQ